ncbi:hypothetical protein F4804DRAFT_330002 [Jackrogersella minutella]|nr:hypothetical protein F4804DRAFT_330002 [Jackrogersella minutella]
MSSYGNPKTPTRDSQNVWSSGGTPTLGQQAGAFEILLGYGSDHAGTHLPQRRVPTRAGRSPLCIRKTVPMELQDYSEGYSVPNMKTEDPELPVLREFMSCSFYGKVVHILNKSIITLDGGLAEKNGCTFYISLLFNESTRKRQTRAFNNGRFKLRDEQFIYCFSQIVGHLKEELIKKAGYEKDNPLDKCPIYIQGIQQGIQQRIMQSTQGKKTTPQPQPTSPSEESGNKTPTVQRSKGPQGGPGRPSQGHLAAQQGSQDAARNRDIGEGNISPGKRQLSSSSAQGAGESLKQAGKRRAVHP